jgi:hypothetical protein
MYVKYQVETWILYYSNIRQLQLIQYAKDNPKFIFIFILSLLVLVMITMSITLYFRRPLCNHKVLCILEPLLKKMKKEGYTREKGETLHQYFLRYMEENPERITIKEVDQYYEKIFYGGDSSEATMKKLKQTVKKSLSA